MTTPSPNTCLVVDFSAVFWRNWHASADEALSFAVQRTVDSIAAHSREYQYTVVCFDSPNCWRRDLWSGYKATRPAKDEAALEQMRQAQAKLSALYPTLAAPRCEADDVIAHVVGQLSHALELTLLSADKDLLQLLRKNVSLWHIGQGKRIAADDVPGILGVRAADAHEWLALVGDKSDNVLGVDGVGPKRASELLTKYGSIPGIYAALKERPDEFAPKQRAALLDAETRQDCPIHVASRLVFLADEAESEVVRDMHDCGSPVTDVLQHLKHWKPKETNETMSNTIDADFDEAPAPEPVPTPAPSAPAAPLRALAEPTTTRALAPVEWSRALEPTDSKGAYGLAKVVVGSRMFSSYGTPEQAMLVIMAGREFGLGAMASLRSFHVVEGKPTMSAQAMMARCLEHPSCKLFRVVRQKCSNELAVVEVQRHGWPDAEVYTWSLEDAKRAGLAGRANWSKYPREMLINRCIAEAARFVFPEVMAGVYAPEEFGGVS